jgi:spore coat protein CotH
MMLGACGDSDTGAFDAGLETGIDVAPEDSFQASDGSVDAKVADVPAPEIQKPEQLPDPPEACVVFTPEADDPSQALFNPECVVDVQVEMSADDWSLLSQETRTFVEIVRGDCLSQPFPEIFSWFKADVTVSGKTLKNVGIRKKGFLGSLSMEKPSLKLRFDKFEDDQLLAGLSRMTLNNMIQDPSLLNACLGYAVMAKAGLPAPRCNFARVAVNGQDFGVYAHVDSIKKPFLAQRFTSDEGNLYEATLSDFRTMYRGTWEKKTNEKEDDWSDLDAAVEALKADDAELIPALDAVFDLDAFYTFWAAEILIGHWDGYAGNLNNTYLYADPSDGRFRFIPWGVDSAFLDPQQIIQNNDGGELPHSVYAFGHLAFRLYNHPEGQAQYAARLSELLESAWNADELVAEVDRMEAMLSKHLPEYTIEELANVLEGKRSWIKNRKDQLLNELNAFKMPNWVYPPRSSICWVEAGGVSGSFDTEWGTSGWDYLNRVGTIETDAPFLGKLGNIAANARDGNGWSTGQGVIELIGNEEGGAVVFLVIFGDPELFVPNTSIPIDWVNLSGVIGRADIFNLDFVIVGALEDGTVNFQEVSTFYGERVIGEYQAAVVAPP